MVKSIFFCGIKVKCTVVLVYDVVFYDSVRSSVLEFEHVGPICAAA